MCVYLEEVGDWVSCEPDLPPLNGDVQEYYESTGYVPADDEEPMFVFDDKPSVWGDEPF